MSDWDVVAEKPASSDEWSVANEALQSKKPETKDKTIFKGVDTLADIAKSGASGAAEGLVTGATLPFDAGRATGEYIANRGVDLAQGKPVGQVAKDVGSDLARGATKAALYPVELGAEGTRYLANKITGKNTPYNSPTEAVVKALGIPEGTQDKQTIPNAADYITKTLGLDYTPKTTAGQVTKLASGLAPLPLASEANLAKIYDKLVPILDGVKSKITENAKFQPPKVINEDTKAAEAIVKNLQDLHKAGGEAPATVMKMIKEARAAGTPLSVADVGGEQNRRLAGVVFRKGGAARELMKQKLAERDAAAQARLDKSLGSYLGSGSVRQTVDDLATARSAAGKPLFEKAMQGGSIAPLEVQYQKEFKVASDKVSELTSDINKRIDEIAKLKTKSTTGYDSEALQKLHAAQFDLSNKERELKQAAADKDTVLQHLREAHVDRVKGTPGAVWSPQIQRLTQNPIIKSGLNRGMQIERNLADAEGRVFDPTEYATVKGANGELEVAKVPNMRVLSVAKEGLDNILSSKELRDPKTMRLTKEGVSIQKLRDSLVSELDRINPAYKEARDVWAGDSAKINALDLGESAFNMSPDEIQHAFSKMSTSEQEFARMGLAEKMREKLLKTRVNGDEAKALLNNEWTRQQIRPFFKSEKDFNQFVKDISAERTMFESGVDIARNSLTADRQAADMADKLQTGVQAGRGVYDAISGAYRNAAHIALTLWQKSKLWDNPEYNEAIARLMFDPNADFSKVETLLAKAPKK
jgi:hypothetical protein